MSNQSVTKVPHIHAEVIKAWADGEVIEHFNGKRWLTIERPYFVDDEKYRVKPEPPAKAYPTTQMTDDHFSAIVGRSGTTLRDDRREIANAALRHAIDAGQVISLVEHQAEMIAFGVKLRDAARGRDMAVAEAVCKAAASIAAGPYDSTMMMDYARRKYNEINVLDLVAIIAKVPPC